MEIKLHPPGNGQRFPVIDIVKDNLYARMEIRGNKVYPTSVYYNPYFVPGFINQGCFFCEVAKLLNLTPEEWSQIRNFLIENFGIDIGEYKLCAVVTPNVDLPNQPYHLLIAKVPGSGKSHRMFISVQTQDGKKIYTYIPENIESQMDIKLERYLKKLALLYSIDPLIKNTVEAYFQRFFNKPFPFASIDSLIQRASKIREEWNKGVTLKKKTVKDKDIFKPEKTIEVKPEKIEKKKTEEVIITEPSSQGNVLTLLLILVFTTVGWYFFRRWF